jgi:hypothetical protein
MFGAGRRLLTSQSPVRIAVPPLVLPMGSLPELRTARSTRSGRRQTGSTPGRKLLSACGAPFEASAGGKGKKGFRSIATFKAELDAWLLSRRSQLTPGRWFSRGVRRTRSRSFFIRSVAGSDPRRCAGNHHRIAGLSWAVAISVGRVCRVGHSFARCPATGKLDRRSGAGVLRRRDDRCAHHRIGAIARPASHLTDLCHPVQRRPKTSFRDRSRAERGWHCRRGSRPIGIPRADYRAADSRADRPTSVGPEL